MKNKYKVVLSFLFAFAMAYLGISFIVLDFNVSHWDQDYRTVTVFSGVLWGVVLSGLSTSRTLDEDF